MTDRDSTEPTSIPASRATDLIADFHARHEAWRRQGEDLARLRADARSAAALEAETILATARADMRRILVDARKALLVLTAQLEAINGQAAAQGDQEPDEDVPESVAQARRDLHKLMGDLRPDLDEVEAQVHQFTNADVMAAAMPPPMPEPAPKPTPILHAVPAPIPQPVSVVVPIPIPAPAPVVEPDDLHEALFANLPPPRASASPNESRLEQLVPQHPAEDPRPPTTGKRGFFAVFALIATIGAGAAAPWLYGWAAGTDDLAPPLSSIPRPTRAKPAWLDEQPVPTLSASLISLPTSGTATPAAADAASSDASQAATVSVDLEARRAAWVQSAVDSGAPTTRTFRAGETIRLQGTRGISITVRDAGAVFVSFNGGPRAPLGSDGQVVTRRFGAADGDSSAQ